MASQTVARAAFSRQHYDRIADAIEGTPPGGSVVDAICAMFAEDNPRFQAERFLSACGRVPKAAGWRVQGMPANYHEHPMFGDAA
jgi:hypothetical protein